MQLFCLAMVRQLEQMKNERSKSRCMKNGPSQEKSSGAQESYECVAIHVSPDLGERIMLSGERALLDEVLILLQY